MTAALQLWLIGQGITDSPSPVMQRAALRARGVDGDYRVIDVDAAELGEVLARLRRGEAHGANVTIPHKLATAAACDRLEGDAVLTGAVNTVVNESGTLVGDNTDARGLEAALCELGMWPRSGARVLILGAGGAAAAAVLAMSRVPASTVVLAVRSASRGAPLAARMRSVADVLISDWSTAAVAPHLGDVDVVINATPASLHDMPFHPRDLPTTALVVDLRYRPRPVDLVRAAAEAGLQSCDGLEMLLHQGMLSFGRWTGAEPPWSEARAALLRAVEG
ncbi:MAG TPA: shikimate dehydrogenase [Candidatus Dormibacteraeota bacterium]|nr:shikimate dehydrogenase [Candidatus Dormibacteraeota bacterium]